MSSPLWKYFLAGVALMLSMSVDARAQICGDGDNSGAVTVTDGVQTLTDGVNVLRKAAGLPITENCGGGGVNAQIQELLQNTVPIFGGLTKIGSGASAAGGDTFQCDNVDGFFGIDGNQIFFDNCVLDGTLYDGTLSASDDGSTLSFALDFTDLATGEFFSFFGNLSYRNVQGTNIIAGNLDISFSDLGDLFVDFEDVALDSNGNFVGGSLLFNATDADIEGVVGIRVGFTTTTVSPVTVFLSDDTELDFTFDIVSGALTPVAN